MLWTAVLPRAYGQIAFGRGDPQPPSAAQIDRLAQTWKDRGRPRFWVTVALVDERGNVLPQKPAGCATYESILKEILQKAGILVSDAALKRELDLKRIDELKSQPQKLQELAAQALGREPGMLLVARMTAGQGNQATPILSLIDLDEGAEKLSRSFLPLTVSGQLQNDDIVQIRRFAYDAMREVCDGWTATDRELSITLVGEFTRDQFDRIHEAASKNEGVSDTDARFAARRGGAAAEIRLFFRGRQIDVVADFLESIKVASRLSSRVTGERPNSVEVTLFTPLPDDWHRVTEPGAPDAQAFRTAIAELFERSGDMPLGVLVTPGPLARLDADSLASLSRLASFDQATLASQIGEEFRRAGFPDVRDLATQDGLTQPLRAALASDPSLVCAPEFVAPLNGVSIVVHCQASPMEGSPGFAYLFKVLRRDTGQVIASLAWPDKEWWRYDIQTGFDPAESADAARYVVGRLLLPLRDWIAARAEKKRFEVALLNTDQTQQATIGQVEQAIRAVPGVKNLVLAAGAATVTGWTFAYEGDKDITSLLRTTLTSEPFNFFPVTLDQRSIVVSAREIRPLQPVPPPATASLSETPPAKPAPAAPLNNRRALIIGINDYQDAPLRFAVADATLFHSSLISQCGYPEANTILLTSELTGDRRPTEQNILAALGKLLKAAQPGDQVLIYFSGHGAPLRSDDATVVDAALCALDVSVTGGTAKGLVPISALREMVRKAVHGEAIFFIDACHSGVDRELPLVGPGDAGHTRHDFARGAAAEGMITLAACRAQEVARENPSIGHGWFTYFLNEGLTRGDADQNGLLELDELYKYTFTQVTRATNGLQNPFLKASVSGMPVLVKRQ